MTQIEKVKLGKSTRRGRNKEYKNSEHETFIRSIYHKSLRQYSSRDSNKENSKGFFLNNNDQKILNKIFNFSFCFCSLRFRHMNCFTFYQQVSTVVQQTHPLQKHHTRCQSERWYILRNRTCTSSIYHSFLLRFQMIWRPYFVVLGCKTSCRLG